MPVPCQEETLDGSQGRMLGQVSRESTFWRKATRGAGQSPASPHDPKAAACNLKTNWSIYKR
jgi:hypothetical protein